MKVLIIRLSSIGDIVLTSPVIRCLYRQIPGVEIHYLTKSAFLPVLKYNFQIHRIHTIQKDIWEVMPELKLQRFDYIIDLHHNLRSALVRKNLGVKAFTFRKHNIAKWLLVHAKLNRMPSNHIVDRYLYALRKLHVVNDGLGLEYFIPASEETDTLQQIPAPHRNDYVAWAIGGQHFTKRLPEHKIVQYIQQSTAFFVLLGGKEDEAAGEKIAHACGSRVLNLCGKLSLNGSAALVKNARVVCTNDTGLMHIAAAYNREIHSFWGNTIPAFGMYPYMPLHPERSYVHEVGGLPCRPCSKIGFHKCPKGHFRCMKEMPENIPV